MNIFKIFSKKEKPKTESKEFVFEVSESVHVGDLYRYTVKANSEKEAFNKLVKYFFGKDKNQEIKSEHSTFSYPNNSTFEYRNMPRWFAKRISGYVKENGENYQKKT